jgi:NAD(P)-dependent dehydrogenase (short-subunit alcohol dehydrogenase family)
VSPSSSLNSSRAVVLGGTGGLGLAVARAAAGAGADVIVGSRSSASVERAVAALSATSPGTVTGRTVDVTDAASVREFFAAVGPFDHLVYTAGDELVGVTIDDYAPEQARSFFDVRLFRALDCVRLALPTLRSSGSITLTSGTAAYRGGPGWLLGSAVCGAMISAARSLAAELSPLRVNVVAPGVVRTALWSGMAEADRAAMYAAAGDGTLLGRVAEPDEVAKAYVHLMEQTYTTGTVSLVDGGTVLA